MTGEYGMLLNTYWYSGVPGTPYHKVNRKYIFIASHRHVQNEDALKNANFPYCVQPQFCLSVTVQIGLYPFRALS